MQFLRRKSQENVLENCLTCSAPASPWLLNALMNFRPGNWATSLKRDESKYSEWTNKKKKKEKKKTIKEGLAGGWRRTHNHNCAPRKLYPHPHPHPDLRRLYAKVSKDLSLSLKPSSPAPAPVLSTALVTPFCSLIVEPVLL